MGCRVHLTVIIDFHVYLEGEEVHATACPERIKHLVAEGKASWFEPPTAEADPAPPSIRPKPRKKAVQ